jgi:hypothetical protein
VGLSGSPLTVSGIIGERAEEWPMVEGWKEGVAIYGWGPRTEIELAVDLGLACAAIMEENECSDERRREDRLLAESVAGRRDGDSEIAQRA